MKIIILIYLSQLSFLTFAQPQIQEIIVTSQKREESLQDVSVSVTAIDGDKLADKGIARVEELAAYVPNLTLTETGIGTTIYIRGIGSGINQGFEQSVGMYVDGVYYGRAQLTRSPFFDMERVEVLRGPQVTLFGNNSIGGALSFTTARPTEELSATVSVTHGDQYGEKEMVFIANGAINNSARVRLAYRKFDFNGYLENLTLNRDEPKRNYDTVRLTFDFDITDSWQSLLKLEYSTFDVKGRQIRIIKDGTDAFPVNNGQGFSNNSSWIVGSNAVSFQGNSTLAEMWSQGFAGGETVIDVNNEDARYANGDFSENDVENLTWINNFSLNEVDLELTFAHMGYSYDEKCDCDFSGLNFVNFFAEEEYSQQSIEFRFSSPGGDLIDWIAGAYYQQDDLDFNDQLGIPSTGPIKTLFEGIPSTAAPFINSNLVDANVPRVFDQESQLSAIFASSTINFTDATRLILGARYSNIKKEASRNLTYTNFDGSTPSDLKLQTMDIYYALIFRSYPHEIEGELDDERVSWNVILELDLNENNMLYASVTDGFKAGGFDVRSNSVPRDQTSSINSSLIIDPDGFAAGAFEFDREEALAYELGLKSNIGGFLEVNTALYYTEIKNLQTSVFDGALGFNVGNAGAATSKGIEVDGRAAFTENLFMNFSFSAADFEFTDYPNGLCTSDELLELGFVGLATKFNPEDPSTCYNQGKSSNILGIVAGKDRKGTTNQYVADYAGSVGFIFEKELSDLLFNFSIDMNFTDDYHTTQNLDENVIQKAFEKYNARLSLGDLDDRWEFAVLGRNLTDKRTIGFSNNVPLSTTQFGTSTYYGFVSPPRQVLVQGKFNF